MNSNMQLLTVSSPPFWHSGKTVRMVIREILLALLPAVAFATYVWGFSALRVICLSVAVSIATEAVCQKLMKRDIAVDNYSAALIGLLFAFLLPASAPWWLVVFGSFLSTAFGKMIFGDFGSAPLCAPVVGYILCFVSFPLFIDANAVQLSTEFIDPLIRLKYFGAEAVSDISYTSLLLGQQIGALGASQGLMLLLAGIFLCMRGDIAWEIAVSFIAGVLVTAFIFQMLDSTAYASPLFHLFTGSTLLGAFFLATDMPSSPNTSLNMFIYGFVGGILVILIRTFGIYTDGVPFAILLINLIMPLLEGRKKKPFGME